MRYLLICLVLALAGCAEQSPGYPTYEHPQEITEEFVYSFDEISTEILLDSGTLYISSSDAPLLTVPVSGKDPFLWGTEMGDGRTLFVEGAGKAKTIFYFNKTTARRRP